MQQKATKYLCYYYMLLYYTVGTLDFQRYNVSISVALSLIQT